MQYSWAINHLISGAGSEVIATQRHLWQVEGTRAEPLGLLEQYPCLSLRLVMMTSRHGSAFHRTGLLLSQSNCRRFETPWYKVFLCINVLWYWVHVVHIIQDYDKEGIAFTKSGPLCDSSGPVVVPYMRVHETETWRIVLEIATHFTLTICTKFCRIQSEIIRPPCKETHWIHRCVFGLPSRYPVLGVKSLQLT